MKVKAYKCDHCGNLFEIDEGEGLQVTNELFEQREVISTIHCDKTNIHFCMKCFNNAVTDIVKHPKFKDRYSEYSTAFKREVVRRSRLNWKDKRKLGIA